MRVWVCMLMLYKILVRMRKVNFTLTAVTIQNDRIQPAFDRLNPELNSPTT
jgi:hypothetical protein